MNRDEEAVFYELLEIDSYPEFTNIYRDIFDYYGANESDTPYPQEYNEYQYDENTTEVQGGALAMDYTGDAPFNYAGAAEPTHKKVDDDEYIEDISDTDSIDSVDDIDDIDKMNVIEEQSDQNLLDEAGSLIEEYKSEEDTDVDDIIEQYDDDEETSTNVIDDAIKEELRRIQKDM